MQRELDAAHDRDVHHEMDALVSNRGRRESKSEIDLGELFILFWRIRIFLLLGTFTGAAAAYLYALSTRQVSYSSSFLVQTDLSSYATTLDNAVLAPQITRLINSPQGLIQTLKSILQTEKSNSRAKKQIIDDTLIGATENYVRKATQPGVDPQNLTGIRLFKVLPSEQSGVFIISTSLPFSGYRATLGDSIVNGLNKMVQRHNETQISAIESSAKFRGKNQKEFIQKIRADANTEYLSAEKETLGFRTELAGMEYDLAKLAKGARSISDYFYFKQSTGFGPRQNDLRPGIHTAVTLNPATGDEFITRIEKIIQLISALRSEGLMDELRAKELLEKIAAMRGDYSRANNTIAMLSNNEVSLNTRLNADLLEYSIQRSQAYLPTFTLDKEYYKSLLGDEQGEVSVLEAPVYSKDLKKNTAAGAVLGLLLVSLVAGVSSLIAHFQKPLKLMELERENKREAGDKSRKGELNPNYT